MTRMPPKKVADSAIHDHTYKVFPNDLNSNDTMFGGLVMSILDRVALVTAERHAERVCMTVSVDALHFLTPARKGDILIFRAAVNRAWRTSMEIGVKVLREHYQTTDKQHILSAYFTFVAVDEFCRPAEVPQLIPETPLEKQRFEEADLRRMRRNKEKQERLQYRKEFAD